MPVYNGERYIEEALDSFLSQTCEDFELIISDNASTDGTEAICRAYALQDERIRFYPNRSNRGAAWNFNNVFKLARGEYFKWAAHDDFVAPACLERCLEVLEADAGIVVSYPKTIVVDEESRPVSTFEDKLHLPDPRPSTRFWRYLKTYHHPRQCHPVFGLIRSDTLRKTSLIGNYVGSDRVLLGELVLRGKIIEIDERLFYSRFHPQSSVRAYPEYRDRVIWFDPRKRGKLQMLRWILLREYLGAIDRTPMAWDEKVQCYSQMSFWCLRNGRGLAKDLLKGIFWPFVRPIVQRRIKK
jgi:glycosyltransferase involved in cell wall biosynthesis